jgi:isopentenyl-diphosphate delta-isomerase
MPGESRTEQRKRDHVEMILKENVSSEHNFWGDVQLVHDALPEVDFEAIDTTTTLFGRKLAAPLVISSMTGGFGGGREINAALASGAAEVGVAMGVGSQRAAIEKPELADTYRVAADYDVPLRFANLGAPQLVPQGGKPAYGADEARRAVDMVGAHALIIHLNFLQEVVQPEGDRNAKGCLEAIAALAREFPVLAKETGAGISRDAALRLKGAGVRAIDVGGLGGTTFSAVEHHRAQKEADPLKARLGATFWNWGIPTPVSLFLANVGLPLVATGGVRTGLDVARSIALGATAAGMAKPLLEAARGGPKAVAEALRAVIEELRAAMFLTGARTVADLGQREALVLPPTSHWMEYARMQLRR